MTAKAIQPFVQYLQPQDDEPSLSEPSTKIFRSRMASRNFKQKPAYSRLYRQGSLFNISSQSRKKHRQVSKSIIDHEYEVASLYRIGLFTDVVLRVNILFQENPTLEMDETKTYVNMLRIKAKALRDLGKWNKALSTVEQLIAHCTKYAGPNERNTLQYHTWKAEILASKGDEAGIELFDWVIDKQKCYLGPEDLDVTTSIEYRANAVEKLKKKKKGLIRSFFGF